MALVGRVLKRISLSAMVDPQHPVRGGVANSDLLKCGGFDISFFLNQLKLFMSTKKLAMYVAGALMFGAAISA